MKIKNILKNWNLFEIIFMIVSLITITVCFIVGVDKNYLSLSASLIGVVSVIFVAKGLVVAPYINIVYNILYAILSITQKYYGEAIIYLGLMIPISIISIVQWIKNRSEENKEIVKINKIHGMEYLYLLFVTLALTVAFYFILKELNTEELIISTLSLITSAVASYLMLRRCSYYALGFVANDIILIVLWSLVAYKSGLVYLPTVISFCVFLINDIYGFIHWKLQEKKQDQQGQQKTNESQEEQNV